MFPPLSLHSSIALSARHRQMLSTDGVGVSREVIFSIINMQLVGALRARDYVLHLRHRCSKLKDDLAILTKPKMARARRRSTERLVAR